MKIYFLTDYLLIGFMLFSTKPTYSSAVIAVSISQNIRITRVTKLSSGNDKLMANLEFPDIIVSIVSRIPGLLPSPKLERSQTILKACKLWLHLQFAFVHLFPVQ